MACSKPASETPEALTAAPADAAADHGGAGNSFEIAPGLSGQILKQGSGATAEAGQIAVVHYTGWLYDETAEDKRGDKFDSSVDRDEYFSFMLGAGRVIKGWDQGVVGMNVGETRELTIAPEMGYGDRGAGNVIPPGATLVFEIELIELQGME
jgi:FKBP-type peptidyl-prolyl cis-trans isomerase FkpA